MKLIINKTVVELYNKYDLTQRPRRKREPITKCYPPSLNEWIYLSRFQTKNLKTNWENFIIWLCDYYSLSNSLVNKCNIIITYYFGTKHRHDPSNYITKFIDDGLVDANVITDDSFFVIKSMLVKADYDKDDPRTEIEIIPIGCDINE